MDLVAHSRPAAVAYQDLLRLHLDERAADVGGRSRSGAATGGSISTSASGSGPR
jgi:hypothetical protein